ncbi:MAG: ABC transporter permease, partial [Thermomicrobiales bacterium]
MIVRLVVRRMLFLILVLFGLSVATFTLSHVVPADPARMMAGPRASAASVQTLRVKYGLDKSVPVQYVNYVRGVVRLDFGTSFSSRKPVRDDLRRYLPATAKLGLYA